MAARAQQRLEGGGTPGTEFPVFDCDFGRLGMQTCFDGRFAEGWAAPNGMVAAQVRDPDALLVQQLDLSHAVIGWQPTLCNGAIFSDTQGAAGFHYSEAEDNGVFGSNDPAQPMGRMIEVLDPKPQPGRSAAIGPCRMSFVPALCRDVGADSLTTSETEQVDAFC